MLEEAPDDMDGGSATPAAPHLFTTDDGPEVLDDEKADVYSLGILLIEMFHSFSTLMERARVLGDARKRHFSDQWAVLHPIQYDLASQMLNANPIDRPSCLEILRELEAKGLYYSHKSHRESEKTNGQGIGGENAIADQLQSKIRTLQHTIESQNKEISRLRRLLSENSIDF